MVPPLRCALITCRISVGWGCNMSSIGCARIAYVDIKADRSLLNAPLVSAAGVRNVIQLFAVALVAAPWSPEDPNCILPVDRHRWSRIERRRS